MIKRVSFFFIVLGAAAWLGVGLARHPGMVLIHYGDMIVRLPLGLAVALVLLFVTLLQGCLLLFQHARRIPSNMGQWQRKRRWHRAKLLTDRGLIQFAEGRWDLAEKWLIKGARYSGVPLINYLAAARAAQEQERLSKRDGYLRRAHEATKGSEIAVGLTQAQLQMKAQQQEEALATLQYLRDLSPHHRYVLKLLSTVYMDRKDWQTLSDLLPYLRKYNVLDKKALEKLACTTYDHLLKSHIQGSSLALLHEQWQALPHGLQKKSSLIARYGEGLLQWGEQEAAERLLRRGLMREWSDDLLHWYGHVRSKEPAKPLIQCEKWLKQRGASPALLLCLARLATHCQLWGKARDYLDRLLAEAPSPEVYVELGQWCEQRGHREQAMTYYHRGLCLALKQG